MLIPAHELEPGDYIRTPGGLASLHRIPINKGPEFSVGYMVGKSGPTGQVTFTHDEEVDVIHRWPFFVKRDL